MGYTRVKHLSSSHNAVDYHENAPGEGVGEAICHHQRAPRSAREERAEARAHGRYARRSRRARRAPRAPRARAGRSPRALRAARCAPRAARKGFAREEGTPVDFEILTLR